MIRGRDSLFHNRVGTPSFIGGRGECERGIEAAGESVRAVASARVGLGASTGIGAGSGATVGSISIVSAGTSPGVGVGVSMSGVSGTGE